MNLYEKTINKDLVVWQNKMKKPSNGINKFAKSSQVKMQKLVPIKVQKTITVAVKKMTQLIMFGSEIVTKTKKTQNISLAESDYLVEDVFKVYDKVAMTQGFSFGLGGILLGIADFPVLLSIKMKFLYDCCKLYGYDVNKKSERLFILYIFQLAFSSNERRLEIFPRILNWEKEDHEDINWEKFQMEYRDYIDLVKLAQLLPFVGSVAGGVANHNLLKKLKITAMNCYRLRYFQKKNMLKSS